MVTKRIESFPPFLKGEVPHQIPLNPPFLKGEVPHQIPLNPPFLKGEVSLFGKEGLGEIFILLCDGDRHVGFI